MILSHTSDPSPSSLRSKKNIVVDRSFLSVPDRTCLNRHPCGMSCARSSSVIAKSLIFIILYARSLSVSTRFWYTTLTQMDNEKLIERVRTRTELCDLNHSQNIVCHSTRKEKIWKGIAFELNQLIYKQHTCILKIGTDPARVRVWKDVKDNFFFLLDRRLYKIVRQTTERTFVSKTALVVCDDDSFTWL